ncbi:MAG: RNA pseudouridine synthase [Syntrophobacteraceae bacterium]|jgi:23S rRNA pseudouridine1911/1915/1917 synthase|nr:RNA pseudouridine synthase [Syntrophobacteraceae bacterium]
MSSRSETFGCSFLLEDWPVFYLDNHLLALYKPAGLLVQGDGTRDPCLLDLAREWIKTRYGKPGRVFLGIVHRLDRPVAGALLLARTSKAAARLSEQFRAGSVDKRYLAVVEGRMGQPAGRLVHRLERRENRSSRVLSVGDTAGQEARLSYRVVDASETGSLVEVHLETGRRHQIRAQLAHIGHPIVGDLRYGAATPLPQAQIALLARELTVQHPTRQTTLTFRCPIPRDWPWPVHDPDPTSPPWNWKEWAGKLPDGMPARPMAT